MSYIMLAVQVDNRCILIHTSSSIEVTSLQNSFSTAEYGTSYMGTQSFGTGSSQPHPECSTVVYIVYTYLGWHIEVLLLKCISHLSEGLKTVDLLSLLKTKPILWLGTLLHTHTHIHTYQLNYQSIGYLW